ncbi:MAG: PilN domain-containing protein [Betaproteobacteria bacterium]|nr:PilN domain-containing protein [Betaproteobacteria bacterium]
MSFRINLLPHRAERRARERRHFATLAVLTGVLGLAVVGMTHVFFSNVLQTQTDRNLFLKSEIAKLDKDIAEIKKLKDEIQALLARKTVIETLQRDRAQTVYLLDQLVRQMPEGVYLTSVKQRGLSVSLAGYAQSNARVSTLMRNIESSPWLTNPVLVEIRAATVNKRRMSDFHLNLSLKRIAPQEDGKAPAKDAAGKKG